MSMHVTSYPTIEVIKNTTVRVNLGLALIELSEQPGPALCSFKNETLL